MEKGSAFIRHSLTPMGIFIGLSEASGFIFGSGGCACGEESMGRLGLFIVRMQSHGMCTDGMGTVGASAFGRWGIG